nr:MAG TPA: hypothetical protein [Caudoviricetes sp.]
MFYISDYQSVKLLFIHSIWLFIWFVFDYQSNDIGIY